MTDTLEDLDSLYKDAKRAWLAQQAGKKGAAKEAPLDKYAPENWTRKRSIALIHQETQTLLGNFTEFVHRAEANCRKLVREKDLVAVSAVEEVSGSWWLSEERKIEPRQEWHTQREAILHVQLDKLRLHAPACPLVVCLSYGAIARVELAAETQFAQTQGEAQLVFLPAGTNILDEMSFDSKVSLRVLLGVSS